MTKKILYFCDCCRREISDYESNGKTVRCTAPGHFKVESMCESQNPLGQLDENLGYQNVTLTFEHVCEGCAKGLANAIGLFVHDKRKQTQKMKVAAANGVKVTLKESGVGD